MVIVQIEHIDAVKNLDAILKVPGIDSICVGPTDLSGSMGVLCQMDDPELNKVIDEVCAKTKKSRSDARYCRRTFRRLETPSAGLDRAGQRLGCHGAGIPCHAQRGRTLLNENRAYFR